MNRNYFYNMTLRHPYNSLIDIGAEQFPDYLLGRWMRDFSLKEESIEHIAKNHGCALKTHYWYTVDALYQSVGIQTARNAKVGYSKCRARPPIGNAGKVIRVMGSPVLQAEKPFAVSGFIELSAHPHAGFPTGGYSSLPPFGFCLDPRAVIE